jgi:hypothetical protein
MSFELVDPRGALDRPEPSALSPRLGSVPEALSIGFLINEVSRQTGPDFTGYTFVIEDALHARYRRVDVVRDAKPVLSRPAEQALLDKYRECRGVVTGLAK